MNNEQFRRLLLDQAKTRDGASSSPTGSATPSTLGSRKTAFVPMTPRTVRGGAGIDFARQVAEKNASSKPTKKFKSSGPKGVKLAAGYTDRALSRMAEEGDDSEGETDDREERLKALEDQVRLGQLDYAMFEKIRDEITGGELESTHLVKGLDRQLLDRVRRGEDVMGAGKSEQKEQGLDVDDEFEALEEKEVARVEKEKAVKKGEMAPPPSVAGAKRSRDAILAELKAQRQAASAARQAARPDLGDKFRSIEKPNNGMRVVKDSKGREVLITRDEHGNIKKKVRKVAVEAPSEPKEPEKPIKFLDEDVVIPQLKQAASVEVKENDTDDDDIFEGAGTAYNPLSDEEDEDEPVGSTTTEAQRSPQVANAEDPDSKHDANPDEDEDEDAEIKSPPQQSAPSAEPPTQPMHPPSAPSSKPRNYFKTAPTDPSDAQQPPQNPMSDPTFLAAIKKAGSLANFKMQLGTTDPSSLSDGPEDVVFTREQRDIEEMAKAEQEARLKKRAAMLAAADRDLDDMDLGFGDSRFGDEDEDEEGGEGGKKIKLSEWKGGAGGDDDDDGGAGGESKGGKRKRARRRKGDKESAKDVLGVLERRKVAN